VRLANSAMQGSPAGVLAFSGRQVGLIPVSCVGMR